MKYKVGDRVRIKSYDWYKENKDENGNIRYKSDNSAYPIFFTKYMSRFCDETLTIKCVHKGSYYMNETGSCEFWTDEMIEGLVEEESANYSKVIDNGVSNPIIAKTSSATIDTDKGFYSYSDSDDNLEMEWYLPEGYQFTDENGNVINARKIVLEKKKKEYPKTYEECCKVLDIDAYDLVLSIDYRSNKMKHNDWKRLGKLNALNQILICRDAYWKIAGDDMGLGKPWEPDWEDEHQEKYIIGSWLGTIQGLEENFVSHPFAFPTKEMRDAFYENFKELIEECKELL